MSTAAPLLDTSLSAAKAQPVPSGARSKPIPAITLHLIGSAHLDPVWLWDWREGMNEGIATCRAMSAMLREFPEFRFIRGEAAIYDTIERHAPDLFAEIREHVAAGRWDIVGGNWIQPDTNLPSTEALLRQFVRGKRYFREKFGVEVTAAWAADSFGHSAGLPDILAAAGMESFAFTRPQQKILPLRQQAFWWRGRSGARILAYRPHDGWYASERANLGQRLDACLARAETEGLQTVALFYGLGNHGGGPSRAHLREIRAWADAHPEVCVKHSGLHALFADLRAELAWRGDDFIDTHEGELNFCLRGCSASVARFKYTYRRAEAALLRAGRTAAALAAGGTGILPVKCHGLPAHDSGQHGQDGHATKTHGQDARATLAAAWDTLLFNAFHDILPGSSIERAYDDQLAQLGSVLTGAQRAETAALTALASRIDTRAGAWPVPDDHPLPQPVLIWNPHPWPLQKHVEVEVSLDYRPVWTYPGAHDKAPVAVTEAATGKPLPFQLIPEENDSMVDLLWRRRAVVLVEVPPMGWTLLQMGLDPLGSGTGVPPADDAQRRPIERPVLNVQRSVFVCSAAIGSPAVHFTRNAPDGTATPWLPAGLQVRLYADTWGAWGGMGEEPDSWLLTNELERLTIADTAVLETGPLRHATWVRFAGQNHRSTLELTLYTTSNGEHIELRARAFLADRGVRMKLVLPATGANGEAEFAVPGGTVRRAPCGEVPGGRWVRAGVGGRPSAVGFASNALYGFDTTQDELRATIARTSRYGSDVNRAPSERPWQPCADLGEHVFRALLTPDLAALPRLADELEEPPAILTVPSHSPASSPLSATGSFLRIDNPALRLLALTQQEKNTLEVRLQNVSTAPMESSSLVICLCDRPVTLPAEAPLAPGEIGTWRIASGSHFPVIRLPATAS
ncbi:alpha-mannosidase [Opitutaceae bacterium TAV1]|nr:alpha-mannosidase [Opitutaceae bacterium TAV1]